MQIKIMKRVEAEEKGLKMFYLGKKCKWGHDAVRLTRHGANFWRDTLGSENAVAGICYKCVGIMDSNNGIVGKTFKDIIMGWSPDTDCPESKYLPVLSGTSKMGYKVVGKALIDSSWYEDCIKYIWVFDANDYVLMNLSKENLKSRGLKKPKGKTESIRLHRYIMAVSNEVDLHVDHVNGDRKDNRFCNLRLSTLKQNSYNSKTFGNVPYKGVSFYEQPYLSGNRCYKATIFRDGKIQFTKWFYSDKEAAKYYDNYLRKNFPSEFNVYNFPEEGELSAHR